MWRVCVTAGFLGRGRGVSKDFSGCPLCTLAWLQRACVCGQRWISDCIMGWELRMSYGHVFSYTAPFVGSGRENGALKKIWSLSRTMLRDREQGRWAVGPHWGGVLNVCLYYTGRDSLTTSRNTMCTSVCQMEHWQSPGFVTGKGGKVEGLWRARTWSLVLL